VNLAATIDVLIKEYGLRDATDVILAGGSAGGLSTFLNLDRVAKWLPHATVVGAPVAGYFLDHSPMVGGGLPVGARSYPENVKYMHNMFNASGVLSTECQAHYGESGARCCARASGRVGVVGAVSYWLKTTLSRESKAVHLMDCFLRPLLKLWESVTIQ
jgi:hypothetical protein